MTLPEDGVDAGNGGVDHPSRVALRFRPADTAVRVPPGVTIFDAASWNGIAIDSTCGGHGTCKKCKVRVADGVVPASELDLRAFAEAEIADGWRLACRAHVETDLLLDVPPLVTRPKAATVGVGRQVILRPALQKRYVELDEPSLDDQRTDLQRLRDAMDDLELRVELGVLRPLPQLLRRSGWRVTCVVADDLLIDVQPGDTTGAIHAIAFDLGTTTVVATLLDVTTGTPVAVRSMLNKQQPFGADVITRISATMLDPDALERLRSLACETLQELVLEVCEQGGVDPAEVFEVALAGNATMTQLALGIDPEPIGVAPFTTVSHDYPYMPASELGLSINPRARATVFPSLGAYVGGDIVAGLLATGMTRDRRLRLFIDVGTNCEIALGSSERLLCTAAPAGPAFEAAQIRCGMRAAEGAIEVVRIRDDTIELEVIGDTTPLGLCGSGLVDVVAELAAAGLLDLSGRFIANEEAVEPRAEPRTTLRRTRERRAAVRAPLARSGRGHRECGLPLAARRPGAAVRESLDRDGVEPARRGARRRCPRHPAGASRGLVRLVPLTRERRPDRPRTAARPTQDRLGGERRGRRCQDGIALYAGASRGIGDVRRGRVHRALRQARLQRPLRGATRVARSSMTGPTGGRSSRPARARPLRFGLLSTARINERLIRAARGSGIAEIVAVGSRSVASAAEYAGRHGIGHAHGSYEDLIQDPDVEAVYISLPNSLHVEWTIRALEAGKHVLCEKPFSADPDAVRRAFAAAAAHDRLLMEALMWRHSALALRLRELVTGGAIGRPTLFSSILTNGTVDPADPRMKAELEGGALADLGCYAVHAFRHLVGEPTTFEAVAVGSDVDTRFAAIMTTSDGELGQLLCGFGLALQWEVRIVGDDGWLVMPDRWTGPSRIEVHTASGTTVDRFDDLDPFVDQLRNFTLAVAGEVPPLLGEDDAVAQATALRALRAAAAWRRG